MATFGNSTGFANGKLVDALYFGTWFTAPGDGDITSLSGYFRNTNVSPKDWQMAVYAYVADGDAGARLAITAIFSVPGTPTAAAWYTRALALAITGGTKYFLFGRAPEGNFGEAAHYTDLTAGRGSEKTGGGSAFPNPMTGENNQPYIFAIYATYTPSAPPPGGAKGLSPAGKTRMMGLN